MRACRPPASASRALASVFMAEGWTEPPLGAPPRPPPRRRGAGGPGGCPPPPPRGPRCGSTPCVRACGLPASASRALASVFMAIGWTDPHLAPPCAMTDTATDTANHCPAATPAPHRSEEHTSELQSPCNLVCRLLLEKKKTCNASHTIESCLPRRFACRRARPGTLPRQLRFIHQNFRFLSANLSISQSCSYLRASRTTT